MTIDSNDIEVARAIANEIKSAQKVVLTCHTNADGDALGSTLGMKRIITNMGKHAEVITPDLAPTIYSWMPGFKTLHAYEREQADCDKMIDEADLIVMMDFNDLKRIKSLGEKICSVEGKRSVLIDHHLDPIFTADVMYSRPQASATCEIAFRALLATELKDYVDETAATLFYTGIVTDTGGLSYNSSSPELYELVAEILRYGIDKVKIHDKIFNNKSVRRLKLNGFAIEKKLHRIEKLPVSIMVLTDFDLQKYNYKTGDTEGLVNVPLQVKDIMVSCLIMERPDCIKISLRSKGDFPVNEFSARYFGGGGHLNAAGGSYDGTIEEATEIYRKNIVTFYHEWAERQSK